ncbi:MAG: type VI secretion system-associated FHA domain protein TagH [Rubrivivax sp.]|nr:type VI secretion system-associated FHA domain protein TagH [Rubrivivax sp.]
MILTLLAVSLNDQALTRPITARFDTAGGTIGRADHSTMALPDPERYISRKQAEIAFVGNGFTIRNVGAANPITVAQRTLGAGEAAPLKHGDEVRIGGYLLRADCPPVAAAGPALSRASAAGAPVARPRSSGDIDATIVSGARPPAAPFAQGSAFTPAPLSPAPFTPTPFAPSAPLADDNPFADLLGPSASSPAAATPPVGAGSAAPADDPFADLMPPPRGIDPALGGVARSQSAAAASLPDDFDPFASTPAAAPAVAPAARSPGSAAAPAADDPFADLLGDGAGGRADAPSIDQAFGLGVGGDTTGDALARFLGDATPAAAPGGTAGTAAPAAGAGGGLSTDPLQLFGEGGGAAPPAGPSSRAAPAPAGGPVAFPDHQPALHGAYTPPRVPGAGGSPAARQVAPAVPPTRAPSPAPAFAKPRPAAPPATAAPRAPLATATAAPRPPVAAAAPARPPMAMAPPHTPAAAGPASAGNDTAALWHAFCEGAGVDLPLPPGEGAALMRHIGRILRGAVEGTLQLVAVRASTKHELRTKVTQIQASGNNPLKFSADAAAGIAQLLSPPQRGFMDGASAMDDVMLDLVGHSIGTVAGMRAAIEGMLQRFDPAALEERLGAGSILTNLLPASRKARLWELYLQHHQRIRDEAEDDFHTLFGRAFVAAYEEQVQRLEAQQRQRQQQARR